jgi:hypothetical protein
MTRPPEFDRRHVEPPQSIEDEIADALGRERPTSMNTGYRPARNMRSIIQNVEIIGTVKILGESPGNFMYNVIFTKPKKPNLIAPAAASFGIGAVLGALLARRLR